MDELQKAIESITLHSGQFPAKFPKEELETISAHRDEAIPCLRGAIEKAINENDNIDSEYNLYFYALFLLAQFQDRESFPKILELASLPSDTLDFLIGDAVTEGLNDCLFNTYNGDLQLLKNAIFNAQADDFARSAMLDVMGQLYLDKSLEKQAWQDFLREIVYGESIGDYIYTAVAEIICKCHFTEMIPELRRLYQDGRVDEYAIGGYDDCVDMLFSYQREDEAFCQSPIGTVEAMKGWWMFEKNSNEADGEYENNKFSDITDRIFREIREFERKTSVKIGRNDPCPCGSGKKYKKCCLLKVKEAAGTKAVESERERQKWLKDYPPMKTGGETDANKDRIYLEDFYDSESIEIDRLLYLALKHRAIPIWSREPDGVAKNRKRIYLTEAFRKFVKFADEKNIQSFAEYDEKYSIHYLCAQWLNALCELLEEQDEEGLLDDVQAIWQKMKE